MTHQNVFSLSSENTKLKGFALWFYRFQEEMYPVEHHSYDSGDGIHGAEEASEWVLLKKSLSADLTTYPTLSQNSKQKNILCLDHCGSVPRTRLNKAHFLWTYFTF